MRLVTFARRDGPAGPWRSGAWTERGIVDLAAASALDRRSDWSPSPAEIERRGLDALPVLAALSAAADAMPSVTLAAEDVVLGPCVTSPGKIICIGLNYRQHALEAGMAIPATPIVFSKFANTLVGPDAVVTIPPVATQVDYEVELAVVIGRRVRSAPRSAALDNVLGYATANDLSDRALQFRTSQWLIGNSLDGFLPLGPMLVTADDVEDPQALGLRTWLNGALRQDSSTADMIFPVTEIIEYLSAHMTLEPGDVILTGTPSGVIVGMSNPVWIAPGDRVAVEVNGLGRLETTFRT